MDHSYIPNHLDDTAKFLIWDLDVAMIVMIGVIFGIIVEWIFTMIALSLLVAWLYKRSKSGKHKGYGMHLLYWYLPVKVGKLTPPSAIREFIG